MRILNKKPTIEISVQDTLKSMGFELKEELGDKVARKVINEWRITVAERVGINGGTVYDTWICWDDVDIKHWEMSYAEWRFYRPTRLLMFLMKKMKELEEMWES